VTHLSACDFSRERGEIARVRDVHVRNSDAERHLKPQLNLVFRKNLARIQAAGVNGFVKGSSKKEVRLRSEDPRDLR